MSFDMFKNILRQAENITREINFSFFGEPMIHPEFTKFMHYLKDRRPGLRVVMNTNLSLATKVIFEKLIEIKLDILKISIDAASSETYTVVRPGEMGLDLEGKREKNDRFLSICEKAQYWFSLPDHTTTHHVFTVNSINISEVKAFAQKWLPLLGKKDKILFKNVLSYGGKVKDKLLLSHPCNVWDLKTLTIDWTGKVTPCNLDTNMDLAVGSIIDSPLLKLFRSKRMRQIKRFSKRKQIKPCIACIDANNWSRNVILTRGDNVTNEFLEKITG